jgi:lipopolysaccharide biosynthesis glycosyltransferase
MTSEIYSGVVYYALNTDMRYMLYALKSIKSLRLYNKKIKVYLFLFGDTSAIDLSFFEQNEIIIINKPPVSEEYLTSLKWLSLPDLKELEESKLLFVDADTAFFQDVELIFENYNEYDFYAREEAGTSSDKSTSSIGKIHIKHTINQKIYRFLCKSYKIDQTPFFNTGVIVFNNNFFKKIPDYLDFYTLVLKNFRDKKTPYPSINTHMVEEVVTTMMLGKIKDYSYKFIDREMSPFFIEYKENIVKDPGIVMHIWGYFYQAFLNTFPDF